MNGSTEMDVREKLVELLSDLYGCDPAYYDVDAWAIAQHLVDRAVAFQKWISADDRLPEAGGYVVCIAKRNPFSRFMPMVARIEKNGWVNPITEQYISEVTHWLPIPQPPKGE